MLTLSAEGAKIKLNTVVMHIWPTDENHMPTYGFTNADRMQIVLLFAN